MNELTSGEIKQALRAKGIEMMDDPRSLEDIARQFGILPVMRATESTLSEVQALELEV